MAPRSEIGRSLAALALAIQFLTRLPVPAPWSEDAWAMTPRWFPVVGLIVGAAAGGTLIALSPLFGGAVAAVAAVAVAILLTGGLHEDGLADLADGLGGGRDADRALEIMRDSRIGSYGTLALILIILLQLGLILRLGPLAGGAALLAGHAVSRASMALALTTGQYLRPDGAGSGMGGALGAGGLAVLLLTAGAPLLLLPPVAILAGLVGLILSHVLVRGWYGRRLGGVTGDCLGAVQQTGLVGFLAGVVAGQALV